MPRGCGLYTIDNTILGNTSKSTKKIFWGSQFGCAASEGGSVRGSPCGEPARLRFTSLRPPPAATPPDPLASPATQATEGFSMQVVRQGEVTFRCRRFRGTFLVQPRVEGRSVPRPQPTSL
jgi:hypothetical protein